MYFVTADGGGTKLIAILYDEHFNVVATGRAGGTNLNFRALEDIRADMQKAAGECLGEKRPTVETADFVIVGPKEEFVAALRDACDLRAHTVLNEGQAALMAGTGEKYGLLALAGTGSDVFLLQRDHNDFIGGWGTVLGDEGGGFDIGAASLRAAIYAEDGRGEKTLLLPLIKEEWKLHKLWDMVEIVYGAKDQRRLVASVTRITAKAAAMGDETALLLYRKAAYEIYRLTRVVLQKENGHIEGKICTSGGVWKGSETMFEEYNRLVKSEFPEVEIVKPVFDPCVGGAVWRAIERGMKKEEYWPVLLEKFKDFRY